MKYFYVLLLGYNAKEFVCKLDILYILYYFIGLRMMIKRERVFD